MAFSNEELLFATITGIDENYSNTIKLIKFRYVTNGKESDHKWSEDKDKYMPCYKNLEVGCTYIIVIQKVSKSRWIWKSAMLVTPKIALQFHKITGVCPEVEDVEVAMEWLRAVMSKKAPPPPPSLTDLVTW